MTDEARANAAKHYDEDQLAALVSLIAGINAWNRMNAITQQPAGDYQALITRLRADQAIQ